MRDPAANAAAANTVVPSGTPATTVDLPIVANPADSAVAAAFAVELMAANTQAGAILKLQQDGKDLPAATFAPVMIQGARWFKVVSGALCESRRCGFLARWVEKTKKAARRPGGVARLPFAFLIESGVKATAVPGMLAQHADHGLPVYALRQDDGTAWLLVGAFDSPEQSSLYAASLRSSGIIPILVYRKGRMF